MTLLDGEILWNLLWILPLVGLVFYWGWRKRTALLRKFLGKGADDPACVNASPTLRFWRGVLFIGTLVLLAAAAARPSWGVSILPYSGQGRDLMVVFDVSKSMLSQDVRPSRLDHAKWLVRQLCTRNPGDRFGLIAFAGKAFLECPLTIDQTSFLQSVDELSVDTIPVGGTNIQQALSEAVRGFRAAETPHRAVVLITDGDELTGDSTKALDEIVNLKIPLFILGIGDPSQPAIVQIRDERGNVQTLKDSSGNVVSVPLNEKMLASLAARTGGIYVRSTTTNPGLDQIEARIKKLEKHDIDSGKQTRPIERPLYPLLGAFILFCLWLMLGERRNFASRNAVKMLFFCGMTALAFSLPAQDEPKKAVAVSPASAEKKTEKETAAALSSEELYNQGLKAQTQEKDMKKAVQLYEQAIAAANSSPDIRARSAQNLGVMNHQLARAMFQHSIQSLQGQQLDPALQNADSALKQLAVTEEIYKNSLRDGSDSSSVSRNQFQLIQDRKKAEQLKKKIEELKKQQQEARKNTQQAMDQQKQKKQQEQNQKQQQDQKQQQQKQDQKQGQQQKQDQKQGQGQQQKQDQKQGQGQQQKQDQKQQQKQDQKQQQGQNQTDKARESVRQLEQQARDLNQKKMEDQAKKAGEELDKARQAQKEQKDEDARKHLQKALDHLGKDQPQQNQQKQQEQKSDRKDQQDQKKGQDQKQDQSRQQKPDKPLPKPGQDKAQNAKPEPEKEIDKDQAKALLDLMAGDEKKLKDELKERMKRNYGTRPVDKDW